MRWLPHLASNLPAAVPEVVAVGQPSETFPRPWAVVSWVPGDLPLALEVSEQGLLAESLGNFLQRLHEVDVAGVPVGPEHWGYPCGQPVTDTIDRWADHAASELADLFDPTSVREAWRRLRPAKPPAGCIRARAWAFVGPGMLTIANYRHTMPSRVHRLTSMVETIAAEVGVQLR